MTKNKEEVKDGNKDEVATGTDEVATQPKENPIMKKISEEIQKILQDSGLAIQPTLAISANGIMPQVQLVELPKEPTDPKQDDK